MNQRHLGIAGLLVVASCSKSTVTTSIDTVSPGSDASTEDAGATDRDGAEESEPGSLDDGTSSEPDETCSTVLKAVVRDFGDHSDFENSAFLGQPSPFPGLVLGELGPDQKPVHASPNATTSSSGPGPFSQWYNDVPGVNLAFDVELPLVEQADGLYVFDNQAFFPVDDRGFGNGAIDENYDLRNFGFTTEIHTKFDYQGGEVFTFIGDDDLWLFINGRLAIDLGGVHSKLSQSVDLDASAEALGIMPGNRYAMDIFHAERHSSASTYHIETTIACLVPIVL